MRAAHPRTVIHTVASQLRARRRIDRQRRAVDRALDVMRRQGATLHLAYGAGREWWSLSNGWTVPPDVAAILIARPDIRAVGDALFGDLRCQTWRYLDSPKGE